MTEINKSDLWKDEEIKKDSYYIDNPEEEDFPWSESGIRNNILIKELRAEIEALKKKAG